MKEQKDSQEGTEPVGIDLQNANRIHQVDEAPEERLEQEDTMKEMLSTHDDRSQPEGEDEQFGGDAADNRDHLDSQDDRLI